MQKKEIDILDIWRIALRKKGIIIAFALVFMVIAGIKSFMKTPLYRADATILIEEPNTGTMNLESILNRNPYLGSNYVGTYFNTQFQDLTKENGYIESWDRHVDPESLYLKQLGDRLGREALRNIGY